MINSRKSLYSRYWAVVGDAVFGIDFRFLDDVTKRLIDHVTSFVINTVSLHSRQLATA